MKRFFLSLLVLALITWSLPSWAQTTEEDTSLVPIEETVVTATRFKREKEKVPSHVVVITADDIKKMGVHSVPEILQYLGGIMVSDLNGNGMNQQVDMGGFGDTADRHVVVLIDGRRINPIDQSGIKWSTIPVEDIQRIEVMYGSGSVLYGDNAMGGVINIITKRGKKGTHLSAETAIGNLRTGRGYVNLSLGGDTTSLFVGGSRYRTEGYRENSYADTHSIYGKLEKRFSQMLKTSIDINFSEAKYGLPGSLNRVQMEDNRRQSLTPGDYGIDRDNSIMLGSVFSPLSDVVLKCDLSYSTAQSRSYVTRIGWGMSSLYSYNWEQIGITPQLIITKEFKAMSHRITLGSDLYKVDYDSMSRSFWGGFPLPANFYKNTKKSKGFYFQDEIGMWDRFTFNLGARYQKMDYILEKIGSPRVEKKDNKWAWQGGAAYTFAPGSKIYVRAYRSFRYPVVDEYMNVFSGAINTNLRPETSVGYEAGVRWAFLSKGIVEARAYVMNVKDEIAWNGTSNQNENIDKTRHMGGEVNLRYNILSPLYLFGSIGYTSAKFTSGPNDGNYIPLVPLWKASGGAEYFYKGLRLRLTYNYVGSRYFGGDDTNTGPKLPPYRTLDLYSSYSYKAFELFVSGKNILKEEYAQEGWNNSYYPMPEEQYLVGIRYHF